MKKFLALIFGGLLTASAVAQCMVYPVDPSQKVAMSSLIAEGEVTASRSFWNSRHNFIYTSHLVRINQVLKGQATTKYVEIITDGGEVGLQRVVVAPALQLAPGIKGVFFLQSAQQSSQFSYPVFQSVADQQGVVKIIDAENKAVTPFRTYAPIQTLYNELQTLLKTPLPAYQLPNQGSSGKFGQGQQLYSVTGISPTNISAGTSSVLTITGLGFGATRGTSFVEFENADDGGSTYVQPHASQYVSWSNTQIQVMVPTRAGTVAGTAGTGPIRVTVSGSTLSAQTLTVDYGHLNVYYGPTNLTYNTRHQGLNGTGMTWQMYTGFDAAAAPKASFIRAFETWRCNTFVNWTIGATTAINTAAADGVNVIRFDVGSELPGGVLGRCTSYFSGCITGTVVNWYVSELDIVFDDATNWQYGPALAAGTQYDFESVALHELGHGHQLSHVINTGDVMHYSISNSQNKRTLVANNIIAGNAVMARNIAAVCGTTAMTPLNSSNCSMSALTASFNLASSTVCAGQAVTLTNLSVGGPTSYTWTMTGGSPSSSTLQNTSTSYPAGGTYSITLLVSNGSSTSSITQTLSVQSLTVSANSASICAGQQTTLTATGASSYTWNPGLFIGASRVVNPASTTVYTVTGSNGSCTSSATSTVTVNTTPVVTVPNATICASGGTVMTASGATSYTWNPGGLTGASRSLSPASTTAYTVTGSNGSCLSNPVMFTISVNANPTVTVNSPTMCSGTSVTLTASGALTYTWLPGSSTGTGLTVSPGSTTTYTVTGALSGCTSSAVSTVSVIATPFVAYSVGSSNDICIGSSSMVTVSGASSYTWQPGNLSGTVQVLSPTVTTEYSVRGSTFGCMSNLARFTMVVYTVPVVAATSATACGLTPVTLTATGAGNYTWTPGNVSGATPTFSPSSTTGYTITGRNGACTASATATITVLSTPTIGVASSTICAGTSTVITATGATSYTWLPGNLNGDTQTLTPVSTTNYTVLGANASCTSSRTLSVLVHTLPTININNGQICSGNSTVMTASGASTYSWMPGNLTGASQNLSPAATTIYSITGYNGNCAGPQKTMTLTVATSPTTSVNNGTLCSGNSTIITATGATGYTWNPGNLTGNTQTLSPNITTTYTVTGANGNCVDAKTLSINVTVTPTVGIANATICSGTSTLMTASGAGTYSWMPGNLSGASQNLNPAATTAYTITGVNGNCVSAPRTFTISVITTPTVTVNNATLCSGNSTLLTAAGATGFTWNPGNLTGNTQTLSPNITTTYTVTGANGNCVDAKTLSINVTVTPTVSIANATICSGTSTLMTASGAGSYSWMPGNLSGASQNLNPAATTAYTITGVNGNCVSAPRTFTISVITTPTVTVNNATLCSGNSTLLTAAGATGFTWNPGNLTGASQNLSPAVTTIYTITGSNAFCVHTRTVSVNVTTTPTVSISNGSICSGASTVMTASGATGYSWMPGSLAGSSQTLNPAATTIYSITGYNNGCPSAMRSMTIQVVTTPTVAVNNATLCSGNSTLMTASGATGYTWNPGNVTGTSRTFSPLVTTVYTVTGNNSMCVHSRTFAINVTTTPTVAANNATICIGSVATVTAGGATTYSWMPGNLSGNNQLLIPAATTVYSITGFSGSCPGTVKTITVTVVPLPTVAINNAAICSGNSTVMTTSGANGYTWNPGNLSGPSQTLSPLVTTIYTVQSTNGVCVVSRTFAVNVTTTPTVAINHGNICAGSSTLMTASGATSYSWMPGNLGGGSQNLNPAATTVYSITGYNGNCASALRTMTLTVTPVPVVSVNNATLCSGNSTLITASGATTYSWQPGNLGGAAQTLSPLTTTQYTVTGYNGICTNTKILTVNVTATPTLNVTNNDACSGNSVTISASGATTYSWLPGNLTGSAQVVQAIATTVYSITGYNGSCPSSVKQLTLFVAPTPSIAVPSSSICSGNSTLVPVFGAVAYTWAPGQLTGSLQTLSPNSTTIYTITGVTGSCSSTQELTITVHPTPTVIVTDTTICSNGAAIVHASGANSYSWMPGQLTGSVQTLQPAATTVYTVTGSDGSCISAPAGFSIVVIQQPTLSLADGSMCAGSSTVLTVSGAASFTWMPGNLSGTTQTLTPLQTTGYTVTGANAQCVDDIVVTLSVVPLPTINVQAGNTLVCLGDPTTFTLSGASSFTASPGSLTGSVISVNVSGSATYSFTGELNGCENTATLMVVADPCLKTPEIIGNTLTIYPNPVTNELNILLSQTVEGVVTLYNMVGQNVKSFEIRGNSVSFEIGNLPPGAYLIQVTGGATPLYSRVIRQ